VFSHRADVWDTDAETTGAILAAHAATAILAQRQQEQLQAALLTRDRIGQAKGIIMATYGVNDLSAFDMLRRISQETQTKLADVAQRVLNTRGDGE
jgi:AmiR/NasT family two-component response regulator